MKFSLNLARYFNSEYGSAGEPAPEGIEKLVERIGNQLGAVEEVINTTGKYKGIKIVEIKEAKPHPNADKLNVYQMFDGEKQVQVVSGDVNLNVGDKVTWLAPGTIVPSTWGTDKPFTLESRPLRGEMSHGMFAAGDELDINDDHASVLKLDTDKPAGTLFADAYEVEDVIIDIENKMFTHRPDCFGNLGIAREVAGIQGQPFKSPDWYITEPKLPVPEGEELRLTIKNQIPNLVPRFAVIPIKDVEVKPSPLWLQAKLHSLGIRPINNIVDITNFIMIKTGQPLHAYDYDKVKALSAPHHASLTIRHPKEGEKITLLNGKEIEPNPKAMVVAAGDSLVCLGGMMGGANSEVDSDTKNIILEAATWDMYTIRRTSMMHGVFTDAVTRFSKGQSPLQNIAVLAKAVEQVIEIAGGAVASNLIDDNHIAPEAQICGSLQVPIEISAKFVNQRLGGDLTASQIAKLLKNVEFNVEHEGNKLVVQPPFWRTDVEIPEDLVEEIGRLQGYENLPHMLPTRATSAVKLEPMDELKKNIRQLLASAGANELQTYSFVPERLMQHVGQEKVHAFAIRNALSPELQHYRLSLTPSLLEKVHPNIKAGFDQFGLFEINKVHIKGDEDCEGLPREYQTLAFVFASKNSQSGAAYYWAKYYLEYLLKSLHVDFDFSPANEKPEWEIGRQVFAPFEPKRSGFVKLGQEGDFAGFVGEYRGEVRKNLKLPEYCAGFEIDLERILKHQKATTYQPILRFPSIDQDLTIKVTTDTPFNLPAELIEQKISEADQRIRVIVTPVDAYQSAEDAKHKNLTYRVTLQHRDRTLITQEINKMMADVSAHLAAKLKATVI